MIVRHKINSRIQQDETDIKILDILQREGRARNSEIAQIVGLSLPSVGERLKKMEDSGVITGYYAKLDHRKFGKDVTAFVSVNIDSSRHFAAFVEHADALEEIQECHAITGNGTHLLKIRAQNTRQLEKLLAKIRAWQGVVSILTNIVLSTSKESTRIRIHANGECIE